MSRNDVHIAAPPEAVWEVLEDPWLYTQWVIGNKRIRAVDQDWPQPGSKFHHTVGMGPLMTRDETRVIAVEPGRRIELDAHAWPMGTAKVVLELEADGAGTRVTMIEQPTRGPAKWMETPLLHGASHARNTESLRRLRHMVEQRWSRAQRARP